jgi:hypothetical protein
LGFEELKVHKQKKDKDLTQRTQGPEHGGHGEKQGRAKARPCKDLGRSEPAMSRENGAQNEKG